METFKYLSLQLLPKRNNYLVITMGLFEKKDKKEKKKKLADAGDDGCEFC